MEYPTCKRAEVMCLVDNALNGAAVREAQASTDELQESGADLHEGSAYLDDTPVTFVPGSTDCELCEGKVNLYEKGMVTARRCLVSGSCELDWVQKYPQNYVDENGSPKVGLVPCAAEVGCKTVIGLEAAEDGTSLDVSVVRGFCKVTDNGRRWRTKMEDDIRDEPKHYPETGIAGNDGVIVEEDVNGPLPPSNNHSER